MSSLKRHLDCIRIHLVSEALGFEGFCERFFVRGFFRAFTSEETLSQGTTVPGEEPLDHNFREGAGAANVSWREQCSKDNYIEKHTFFLYNC